MNMHKLPKKSAQRNHVYVTHGSRPKPPRALAGMALMSIASIVVLGMLFQGCSTYAPPIAKDDFNTTFRDKSLELDLLWNDQSVALRPLKVERVGKPGNGTAEILPNGMVKYIPNPGYVGLDQFEYVVVDDGGSMPAQVRVMVTPPVHTTAPQIEEMASTAEHDTPVKIDNNVVATADKTAQRGATHATKSGKIENDLAITPEAVVSSVKNNTPPDSSLTKELPATQQKELVEKQHIDMPNNHLAENDQLTHRINNGNSHSAAKSDATVITSNNPSLLIKNSFGCLENNNKACAIQNCDKIADILSDTEMTSLCGTLFDPSMGVSRLNSDPQQAYLYYIKAEESGAAMADNFNRLLDWLTANQQLPALRTEIENSL